MPVALPAWVGGDIISYLHFFHHSLKKMQAVNAVGEGVGSVLGGLGQAVVGAVGGAAGLVGTKAPGAIPAELFTVTINNIVVTSLGEPGKIPASFHPIVAATIKEHDFSSRQKQRALGSAFNLGVPLTLSSPTFTLKASLTTETLCLEIWDDKMVDKFEGRACIPLFPLASKEGNGLGRMTCDVVLSDQHWQGQECAVHTLLGTQKPVSGFTASAQLTITRLQPGATIYPLPMVSPLTTTTPPGGSSGSGCQQCVKEA